MENLSKLLLVAATCLILANYQAVHAQVSCIGVDCAVQARQNIADSNGGCSLNQVYTKVGINRTLTCVQCQPGTSGWTSTEGTCALNEYCDDNGACQPILQSPFYGSICPFESGGQFSLWCGPGLRCYEHKCLICQPGMTDADGSFKPRTDFSEVVLLMTSAFVGKICIAGEWTYSKWAAMSQDPASTWLLLIFLSILVIIPLNVWHIWKYRKEQRAMAAFIRRKSASLEKEEPLTEPEGSYRSIRLPERKDSDRNSKASKGRRDEDDTASASASGEASSRRGEDPIAPVSLYESTEEIIRAVPISRAVERSSSKMEMQEPLSASEDKADQ